MSTKPWKPRASQVGGYMHCEMRAAYDRAIYEGLLPEPPTVTEAKKSSPYADFGTVTHFVLQDGLRCKFPGHAVDHQPEPEQITVASELFSGNVQAMQQRAREVATLASSKLPKTPDGMPWLAESSWENEWCTGHIDFLSQDHSTIVDLKTTSKPPAHQRIKPEHLHQMLCYQKMTGAHRGGILYVDSRAAEWVLYCEIDFTTPAMRELADHTEQYCRWLMSDEFWGRVIPRLGAHCSDGWCPYLAECKNKFLPAPAKIHESTPFAAPPVSFSV